LVFQAHCLVIVHSREKETSNKTGKLESTIYFTQHTYIYVTIVKPSPVFQFDDTDEGQGHDMNLHH